MTQERLLSLGYINYVADEPSPEWDGVTLYERVKSYPGYNIFSVFDTGELFLMDMEGNIVHNWSLGSHGSWKYWWLLENGSVAALYYDGSIAKLDWDSNIIWRRRGSFHHDISVSETGKIYALARKGRGDVPFMQGKISIKDNLITVLDPDGNPIKKVSLYDLLWDSIDAGRVSMLSRGTEGDRIDVFHANTVEVIDRDVGYAKKGDVLICVRHMDLIAIVDLDSEKVIWSWGPGEIEYPHKPTLLENGNILLFDNGVIRRYSRILEVDPRTDKIVWEYVADDPETFYSAGRGSAQKLPNGNVLIAESNKGRLFEITPEGKTVWEYRTPIRTKKGRMPIIYRLKRYPLDSFNNTLARKSTTES